MIRRIFPDLPVYIIDTNVASELMRERRDPTVTAWANRHSHQLHLTAAIEAELWYGAEVLPEGARRRAQRAAVVRFLASGFGDNVLPFDRAAAREFAVIAARRRATGRMMKWPDCEIAAVARSLGMTVATRDMDFRGSGVPVLNPWKPDEGVLPAGWKVSEGPDCASITSDGSPAARWAA